MSIMDYFKYTLGVDRAASSSPKENQIEKKEIKQIPFIKLEPSEEFIHKQEENGCYLPSEYEKDVKRFFPLRAIGRSAGIDLRSAVNQTIRPGETQLISTGFIWNIPTGYVGMVCSRSGLALKKSVIVLNSPGIIDENYTGEIKVILYNLGKENFVILSGDRIAQMVMLKSAILPFYRDVPEESVDEEWKTANLSECSEALRGSGGFGSTGME